MNPMDMMGGGMPPMKGPLAPQGQFKPCAGCPAPGKCTAAGKCLKKGM